MTVQLLRDGCVTSTRCSAVFSGSLLLSSFLFVILVCLKDVIDLLFVPFKLSSVRPAWPPHRR